MIKKENIIHFFIVLLCAIVVIGFISIPIELTIIFFAWQPVAGRVLIYGLLGAMVFYEGYNNIDVIEMDDDDDG
jgi:hypothetical protein